MAEVGTKLNCSVHKVTYWMKKYDLKKRSRSDALYQKLNPYGDPFKIKSNLSPDDKLLFGLGIGIYSGEGNKTDKNSIRVTNTNPKIIKAFRKFLLEICQIVPEKLSYSLVCFNDTDPKKAAVYWSQELNIFSQKFGKIVQIPPQGKGTYKRKSLFGVCTMTFCNTKLKKWLMEEMNSVMPG